MQRYFNTEGQCQPDIQLLQQRNAECPFVLKSKEANYKDLERSRQQIADGNYQDAREFIVEVRKECQKYKEMQK